MSTALLSDATVTGAGSSIAVRGPNKPTAYRTFQAVGSTSSGAGAVSAAVEVSNDNRNWLNLGTISLTLSNTAESTDGFASLAQWSYVRGNVTSISGTGAKCSLYMGV